MPLIFRIGTALICAWTYLCPVALGVEEGDWADETVYYALDQWEIGHTHTLRAQISFPDQNRTLRGYLFIANGEPSLYKSGDVHFALISFDGPLYTLEVHPMKGISSTLSYYLKRKTLSVRQTVAGIDKGSLFQINLELNEGFKPRRSGVMGAPHYRLISAVGLYEITSRPRLYSGKRQVMILDLNDVKNPFDRSSYCSYWINLAARWLESREPFTPLTDLR